jgi:hypothetical protein
MLAAESCSLSVTPVLVRRSTSGFTLCTAAAAAAAAGVQLLSAAKATQLTKPTGTDQETQHSLPETNTACSLLLYNCAPPTLTHTPTHCHVACRAGQPVCWSGDLIKQVQAAAAAAAQHGWLRNWLSCILPSTCVTHPSRDGCSCEAHMLDTTITEFKHFPPKFMCVAVIC